jgi:hypothetical protein
MAAFRFSKMELFFLLALCGKLYFLFGFLPGSHLPAAPIWIIGLRDVFLILFLSFGLVTALKKTVHFPLERTKPLFFYLASALVIALLHLFLVKDLETFFQHYIRNAWIPILVIPFSLFLLEKHPQFSLKKVILTFSFFNIVASILQILFFRDLMWQTRPTGIVGDPLISSAFILLSTFFLSFSDWRSYLALILGAVVIYASSSISAFLAWVSALLAISFLFRNSLSTKKALVTVALIFGTLGGFYASDSLARNWGLIDGFDSKISALASGEHWSVSGRILSNLAPFKMCTESFRRCIFGDLLSEEYHKVDATWASLTLNWGVFIAALYFIVFLVLPFKIIYKSKDRNQQYQFAVLVFFFYWAFSFFNSVPYKHPLNILFYFCLAIIWKSYYAEEQNQ